MRSKFAKVLVFSEVLEVHYLVWDGPSAPLGTLFCAHAMLRNHYDFVPLAAQLSRHFKIVALDLPGHGFSGWLSDKPSYRGRDVHLQAVGQILLREASPPVIYVGTSLGGLIGLQLAALTGSPLHLLILNDIAPEVNETAKRRFLKIVATDFNFPNSEEAEMFLDKYISIAQCVSSAEREEMFKANVRQTSDGSWHLNFDPDIKEAYRDGVGSHNQDHWHLWADIQCPVLVLRGAESSFVEDAVVARMQKTHGDVSVFDVPGSNHPPDLATELQTSVILNWCRERRSRLAPSG